MLSRCKPPPDSADPQFGLSSVAICTTDIYSHEMIDGFKSFPSGHSSCKFYYKCYIFYKGTNYIYIVSFSGLMYLAYYIAGKMKMFDQKGVSEKQKQKILSKIITYIYIAYV